MKFIVCMLVYLLFGSVSTNAQDSEEEIIMMVYGSDDHCDHPLDRSRMLVAMADFVQAFTSNNGTLPDISTLPHNTSCDALYYACQEGGCCGGTTCKLTSNGLRRCVAPTYEAQLAPQDALCDRGQPCASGLTCMNDATGKQVCSASSRRRLGGLEKVGKNRDDELPSMQEIAREYLNRHSSRALRYCLSAESRQCGRCTVPKQARKAWKYCSQSCGLFRCGRRRMLEESGTHVMDNLVAAMTTYIHALDFGDDCDPSKLGLGWKIGRGDYEETAN